MMTRGPTMLMVALWLALAPPVLAAGRPDPEAALRGGRLALTEALAQARARRRTLVLDFSTGWCEACMLLEREVLPDPRVQRALGGVLFVRYDAEAGPGLAAARSLKIVGYPTLVALAADGSEISRIQGVPQRADFGRWLEQAAEDSATLAELEQGARAHPEDGRVLLALARRYQRNGQERQAQALAAQARQAAAGHDDEVAAQADFALQVAQVRAALRDEPRRAMAAHLSRYPRGPRAEQALVALGALGALGPADALARQALSAYVQAHQRKGDEELLNQAVYVCLRVGALAEAEAGARWLVAAGRTPDVLDTLAEVRHQQGDSPAALRLSEEALALVKGEAPEARSLRHALRQNQERYRRGHRESPPDQLREDDSPLPWEKPVAY